MIAVIRPLRVLCLAIATLTVPASAKAQGAPPQAAVVDDPDARPPVTVTDLKILKRAGEILDSPAHWNRADDRKCPPGAKTFSLYCALEKATVESGQGFEHRGAALQEVRFVIDEVAAGRNYKHRLMNYNNDQTTTLADIQEVLRIAEDLIALRLKMESQSGVQAPSLLKGASDLRIPKGWCQSSPSLFKIESFTREQHFWEAQLSAGHQPWRRDPSMVAAACLSDFGIKESSSIDELSKCLIVQVSGRKYALSVDSTTYIVRIKTSHQIPIAYQVEVKR